MVRTNSGEIWYWGGFAYDKYTRLVIEGFNKLSEDDGLPKGKKFADMGLGFASDIVVVDDE